MLSAKMSVPGTPRRVPSRPMSRSTSPTRSGAPSRKAQSTLHPLHITPSTPRSKTDPLRVLTTDLIQRIFSMLSTEDLATSSRVSLKWNKSKSLNYLIPYIHRILFLTHLLGSLHDIFSG